MGILPKRLTAQHPLFWYASALIGCYCQALAAMCCVCTSRVQVAMVAGSAPASRAVRYRASLWLHSIDGPIRLSNKQRAVLSAFLLTQGPVDHYSRP